MYRKLLIICVLLSFIDIACAESDIKIPDWVKIEDYNFLKINEKDISIRSKIGFEIFQFNSQNNTVNKHFKSNDSIEKLIYQLKFKDAGKEYNQALNAYMVNGVNEPLITYYNCFIDDKSDIYCIAQGLQAKSVNGSKIDFQMIPFFLILQLGNEKIIKAINIEPRCGTDEYYFRPDVDFLKIGENFIFGVSKNEITNNNYFLGEWKFKLDKLYFDHFLELELPQFHVKSALGYGLMRFNFKEPFFMFYSNLTLFNITSLKTLNLSNDSLIISDFSSARKNETFQINYNVCDFIILESTIKIIERRYSKFYVTEYDILSLKKISEKKLEGVNVENLARFPSFSNENLLYIVYKGTNKIQTIKI
jgi:hypothetical protein